MTHGLYLVILRYKKTLLYVQYVRPTDHVVSLALLQQQSQYCQPQSRRVLAVARRRCLMHSCKKHRCENKKTLKTCFISDIKKS